MARRGGNRKAPENETKAARFKRMANIRLPLAVKAIGKVAQLNGSASYEYDQRQVDLIVGALEAATDRVKRAFAAGDAGPDCPQI
jgi:hypothetical protein